MPADPFYRTPAWRQLRDKRRRLAKAAAEPCHRCGADIDYTLKAGPWSPTIDHITARRLGGEQLPRLDDLAPAHRRCNSIHGAHVTAAVKAAKKAQQPTTAATAPQPPYRAAPPAPSAPQAATGVFRAGRAAPRGGATVITPKVTTNTAGDAGVWGGECGQPRFLSPQHPRAVATLADEWLPWIESPAGAGITLRPWQRVVLRRALEVDADGLLCWRTVVVSTPRQSGKSWIGRAAITARCHHGPGRWSEPQECLHVANALVAARRIQSQAWRWAEGADLDVRRAFGAERIIWPDGSHWSLVATKSVWGASGSMVYGDEAWDIGVDEIEQGVVPTMLERTSPQLWLSSTANDDATPLMTGYRAEGIAGSESVMIAEWSVPADADAEDPATWRRWLAHWTPQREEFMTQARGKPSFRSQYLNQWPAEIGEQLRQWPPGWTAAPRAGQPVAGGVAVLESTVNREFYGTAYAVAGADGSVSLWTARHRTLEEATAWVAARSPGRAVVGLSLAKEVLLAAPTEHYGSSHTVLATPVLEDLVRRGLLRHDHSEVTAEQTRHARVIQSERGLYMSGKASRGAIETLKAAAWAAWTATLPALEMPAVW